MSRVRGFLLRMKASGRAATSRAEHDNAAPASAEATIVPSRVTKWREWIEHMLQTDGYIVSGTSEELRRGSVARMWGTDQGFSIIGAASHKDALRQWREYEAICGEKMDPPPAQPSAHWHYYKFGARREGAASGHSIC
jgi:hypothetical protein